MFAVIMGIKAGKRKEKKKKKQIGSFELFSKIPDCFWAAVSSHNDFCF